MNECTWYDVPCWLGWLIDEIKLLFVHLWEGVLNAGLAAINSIPVPSFLQSVGSLSLPDGVIFFANVFQLPAGAGIMVAAYTLRFIIRRIPVIG